MHILHNQTDPTWVANHDEDELGVGIFLIPDVASDVPYALKSEVVDDITYSTAVAKAHLVISFKWVPHRISRVSSMKKAPTCLGDCVDTCPKPQCFCIGGKCLYVPL